MDFTEAQRNLLDTATNLNIGCGHDYRHGYINIDMNPVCNPDILLVDNDFSSLPKNRYEHAVVANIIEHIPRQYMMGALLEWASLLKRGGTMYIETSNPLRLAKQMEEKPDFERHYNWFKMMFGNQAQEGDFHFNGFTEITLTVYLRSSGLKPSKYSYIDDWIICNSPTKMWDWAEFASADGFDDVEFVKSAYRRVLGREADVDGAIHHTQSLANGGTRRDVLKALYSSEERLWHIAKKIGAF